VGVDLPIFINDPTRFLKEAILSLSLSMLYMFIFFNNVKGHRASKNAINQPLKSAPKK